MTSKFDGKRGGRRVAPYAFTEQGVAMLSSVINSARAIEANIQIMRVFVQMRQYVLSQPGADEQIAELRKLLLLYNGRNGKRVDGIIRALDSFMAGPPPPARPTGFRAGAGWMRLDLR